MNEQQSASAPQGSEHAFTVHNIYVKDISYESPHTPQIFATEWKPHLDFDLQMSSKALKDDIFEVVLDVTVTVKLDVPKQDVSSANDAAEKVETEERVAFLVEVKQAGIFSAHGFNKEQVERLLATTAPGILFPYLRENVSTSVVKGGFPQLVLPPMNFDAMYMQHLENKKKEQEEVQAG